MPTHPIALILLGVLVGLFSGVMGLGGGAVMVPAMVLLMGISQPQAHGTSLAVMMLPVGFGAVYNYYTHKNPDGSRNVLPLVALFIAIGMAPSTYFGAAIANRLPKETLTLVFGFGLIYVAAYTVFGKQQVLRTTILAGVLTGIAILMFWGVRWYDRAAAH